MPGSGPSRFSEVVVVVVRRGVEVSGDGENAEQQLELVLDCRSVAQRAMIMDDFVATADIVCNLYYNEHEHSTAPLQFFYLSDQKYLIRGR